MGNTKEAVLEVADALSSEGSFTSTETGPCCSSGREANEEQAIQLDDVAVTADVKGKTSPSELSGGHNYATSKNVAEGKSDRAF